MHDHDREPAHDGATGSSGREAASRRRGLAQIAVSVGNAAFARLARSGSGLLPGGRVHPDVEAAISARRGAGRPLDSATRETLGAGLGESLEDVRVHDDAQAAGLSRAVSARAFTVGPDVYFGEGEYRPGTSDGNRLIAHELTHVVQQRGAPMHGPLTVSEPGDALEQEADATARDLAGD